MQSDLLNRSVEQVRKRAAEGDCPATPALSVEWLEEMVLALAPTPHDDTGLSEDEKRAQGEQCGCRGIDDYCPCQNVRLRRARTLLNGGSDAHD